MSAVARPAALATRTLRAVGGKCDGETFVLSARQWRCAEGGEIYTVRVFHSPDGSLSFLAPEKMNDLEAIQHLLDTHRQG